MGAGRKNTTSVRLTPAIRKRAEDLIGYLAEKHPWIGKVSRSMVLVAAIEIGLVVLERGRDRPADDEGKAWLGLPEKKE